MPRVLRGGRAIDRPRGWKRLLEWAIPHCDVLKDDDVLRRGSAHRAGEHRLRTLDEPATDAPMPEPDGRCACGRTLTHVRRKGNQGKDSAGQSNKFSLFFGRPGPGGARTESQRGFLGDLRRILGGRAGPHVQLTPGTRLACSSEDGAAGWQRM